MDRLIDLHQSRWRSVGRPGSFSSVNFTQFHRKISSRFLDKDRLALLNLKVNGKTQACEYAFKDRDKLLLYQGGYNPEFYENVSVGFVSMSYLVEYAIKNKIKEIELLRGGGLHKDIWSKNKRSVFNVLIARKTIKSFVYIQAVSIQNKIRNIVKNTSVLHWLHLALKDAMYKIRGRIYGRSY